ncbi:MAG: tetratricopeptide repeat protein [Candidatus Ancaeobacter aquaticus]|nr:tetratricopeptide repeat protein [Candidatus Ancaeobacter aquaticus]
MHTSRFISVACIFLAASLICYSCAKGPDYSPEIKRLQEVVNENPDNPVTYEKLIIALNKDSYYKEALQYATEISDIKPDSPIGLFYMGVCNEKLKDWNAAEENYKKLCELFPENINGYKRLGTLYYKKGDFSKCIDTLKKALTLNTADTAIRINTLLFIANAYYYNGDIDSAYASLDTILEIEPDNKEALYDYGLFKLRENNYSDAIQYLSKLVYENPKKALPYFRLGKAYYHSRQLDKAKEAFWNAGQFDPTLKILARLVYAQNLGSTYNEINSAIIKVLEEYNYRQGDTFIVKGMVENMGLEVAKDVKLTVQFYDKDNNLLEQTYFTTSPRNLRPEQYTFFKTEIPYSEKISHVKVEPSWQKRSTHIRFK